MKPPKPYKRNPKFGYSICIGCGKWTLSNMLFRHEGTDWVLCEAEYGDYWENTDELLPDYKAYY